MSMVIRTSAPTRLVRCCTTASAISFERLASRFGSLRVVLHRSVAHALVGIGNYRRCSGLYGRICSTDAIPYITCRRYLRSVYGSIYVLSTTKAATARKGRTPQGEKHLGCTPSAIYTAGASKRRRTQETRAIAEGAFGSRKPRPMA